MGKRLISSLVGKGEPPPGMEVKRWKKLGENLRRAERLTGVAVVSAEGWEVVAVILMDLLEAERLASRRKIRKAGAN